MSICRSYWPQPTMFWSFFREIGAVSTPGRRGPVAVVAALFSDTGNEHADPVAPPQLPLTGLRIHAFERYGRRHSIQAPQHYGVGNREVIDLSFRDAVDIGAILAAATRSASLKSGASASSMPPRRRAHSSSPIIASTMAGPAPRSISPARHGQRASRRRRANLHVDHTVRHR